MEEKFVEGIQLELISADDPNYIVHIHDIEDERDRRHQTLLVIPIGMINNYIASQDLHLINTSRFETYNQGIFKYVDVPDGKYRAMVVCASECIAYVRRGVCLVHMKNDHKAAITINKLLRVI